MERPKFDFQFKGEAERPVIGDTRGVALQEIGKTFLDAAIRESLNEQAERFAMDRENRTNARQDARWASEDAWKMKQYKADQEYKNLLEEGRQSDRKMTKEHYARMEGIAEQKRQDEMKSVKERFMNEKGQVFNLLKNGEVVPVMEKQGRKQLSNEEAFYAPFGDEGMPEESVQMKGMPTKTTGKPDRWSAEQNIKLINERITELKAIEQGDIMNGREPRALTNDEKAELNTLNNNRLALINGGSIETSQASTTTSQNNNSGMRKVSPEKAIANMKAAGLDEKKIQDIIKKEYPDYNTKPDSTDYLPKANKPQSLLGQLSEEQQKPETNVYDHLLNRGKAKTSNQKQQEVINKALSVLNKPIPDIPTQGTGSGHYKNRNISQAINNLEDNIKVLEEALNNGVLTGDDKLKAEGYIQKAKSKLNTKN